MLRESLSLGTLQESEQSEGNSLRQPPDTYPSQPSADTVWPDTQPWEQRVSPAAVVCGLRGRAGRTRSG